MAAFDRWTDALADHVRAKGKVAPGQHRAFGYKAPSHRVAEQQKLGLNRE